MLTGLNYTAKGLFKKFIREGFYFKQWIEILNKLNSGSEDFRRDFQLAALKEIIIYAYEKIPFWRDRLIKYDLDPYSLRSVNDLKMLPFLTKQEVQKNLNSLISSCFTKYFIPKGVTSGTTGTPGVFYRDLRSINFENAMLWLIRSKVGIDQGSRHAVLRGDRIIPFYRTEPPFWLKIIGERKLIVSSYHLIPKFRGEILSAIKRFEPVYAFAYPSAAYILARWCSEVGIMLPFKNLHTSSETLSIEQKDIIRSVLEGNWIDHYGQAERVNFLASFNCGDYTLFSEYSVTELLFHEEGLYEVIGSTLHNYAMPLFRYRTGDMVGSLYENGKNRPTIRDVSGRRDDFIRLPDGRLIGHLPLIFKGISSIVEGQIYQESVERIILRIVQDKNFSERDEKKLIKNAKERVGDQVQISIKYYDKIPRASQNKFRFVLSKISSSDGET